MPSGGLTGSLARDLVKSTPEPIAAAMDPVTGSHYLLVYPEGEGDLLVFGVV
jgi:hypothetical protein